MASMGERLRRFGGWIRRHPLKTIALVPLAVVVYAASLYPLTPSIGDIKKSKQESPSVVLSADGKELAVFRRANRDWVKLSDVSPKVVDALLSTEDKRFYDHHGIDFTRTARAMLNTLTGDVEGGSTITQQLARNLYPEQIGREQTINRKIKEAITALKIEAVYSKDEILESYLNSVSFLYNAWGIEMASRTYFDKHAKDLNDLEAATLVGMLKGTAYYNPVMNPERAVQRRNTVLAMMVKENKLDEARFEQLKAQPLKLDFTRLPEFNGMAPHLTEYLRRWLLEWADKHDYNVYSDGLVVKTTIDSRLQKMANDAVERQGKMLQAVADVEWSRSSVSGLGSDPSAYVAARAKTSPFEYFWNSNPDLVKSWVKDSSEYKQLRDGGKSEADAMKELQSNREFMADLRKQKTMIQSGFLAIEPQTGAIKAWVGSRDYEQDKFDHVSQAKRQPGSTFKPFVYGAAFEMGHQPNETLLDQAVNIQIDKHQVWRPGDIEGAPTNQPMTLRDALAKSKNTVTAQLMMQVGPSRVAALARAMGVRQSKLDEVPSLALGTSPVTLKEMVTSFATIANGGNYIEPIVVTAVEDRDHNVLESFTAKAPEQALQNQADMTLLDVMRGTVDYGTAAGLKPRFGLQGDLAGKTGTTQDNTDGWFILMHPNLVAGAWVGFNDNRVAMRSSYWGQGAHTALLVVGDMMQQAQKGGIVDAKATFAAPHLQDQEKSLIDKAGDWWNSVFNNNAPAQGDQPAVAALPDVNLPKIDMNPPSLEPPPSSIAPSAGVASANSQPPLIQTTPVPADAPVLADTGRVPSFPRPLESSRTPVDTIPGTRVYRSPDPGMATAGAGASGAVNSPATTSMGAQGGGRGGRTTVPIIDGNPSTPVPSTRESSSTASGGSTADLARDGGSSSSSATYSSPGATSSYSTSTSSGRSSSRDGTSASTSARDTVTVQPPSPRDTASVQDASPARESSRSSTAGGGTSSSTLGGPRESSSTSSSSSSPGAATGSAFSPAESSGGSSASDSSTQ